MSNLNDEYENDNYQYTEKDYELDDNNGDSKKPLGGKRKNSEEEIDKQKNNGNKKLAGKQQDGLQNSNIDQ